MPRRILKKWIRALFRPDSPAGSQIDPLAGFQFVYDVVQRSADCPRSTEVKIYGNGQARISCGSMTCTGPNAIAYVPVSGHVPPGTYCFPDSQEAAVLDALATGLAGGRRFDLPTV